ncbi:MAG: OmpA family protein [Spirochaetaceae bacterium]|jgi:outer membrane protein OmpA-like peptidoglycan-associated protein|nr:OmpA family protein [Spirochaetaceae bacterium]
MKKILILILMFCAIFAAVSVITACKSPPTVEEPLLPPEPPPPPPPPPTPPSPPPSVPDAEPPDTSPPEITVTLDPQPFSPDGDGFDDELTITIGVKSASEVHSWHILIREPVPPYLTFSEWSGEGMPPETIVWDGKSASGELVQAASEYVFTVTVNNIYNNYSVFEGKIEVDVLVMREKDQNGKDILRVIVPSIMFAANAGDFKGLDESIMAKNDAILQRIAEVLNEHSTYQVDVEGHANPTTPPGTKAREIEEKGNRRVLGNLPLSEERAKTVADYLVNLGVDRSRLTPIGVGSAGTVVEFADKDNWWKNRRVEFILEK